MSVPQLAGRPEERVPRFALVAGAGLITPAGIVISAFFYDGRRGGETVVVEVLLWSLFAVLLVGVTLVGAMPFWLVAARVQRVGLVLPVAAVLAIGATTGIVLTVTDDTEGAFFLFGYALLAEFVVAQAAIWLDRHLDRLSGSH